MSSFRMHNGDQTVLHQALWADPDEFKDEPFFVFVHEEASVGLVTLQYVREAMQEVDEGDRDLDSLYYELYAKFPGLSVLEQVTLGFAGKPGGTKLSVISETGVEWTCDL